MEALFNAAAADQGEDVDAFFEAMAEEAEAAGGELHSLSGLRA
jgi:hypothetical protein